MDLNQPFAELQLPPDPLAWRKKTRNEPEVIQVKPDAQGRVDMNETMTEAIGCGSGVELWAHYARSPYVVYPSLALMERQYLGQKLVIVGGGSSVKSTIGRYRGKSKTKRDCCIAGVNKSHDWLVSQGIIPDFGVLVDPRPHVVGYIKPRQDVIYFLGLALDDAVFEKFIAAKAAFAVWVGVNHPGDTAFMTEHFPRERGFSHAFVTGLSTVGFRTVVIGSILGFTDFELHGFDSCYAPFKTNEDMVAAYSNAKRGERGVIDGLYAYAKPESEYEMNDLTFEAGDGSTFRFFANNNMALQARNYQDFLRKPVVWSIDGKPLRQTVKVAGDGIIPWMAYKAGTHLDMAAMEKKYGGVKDFDYRCREKVTPYSEVKLRVADKRAVERLKAAQGPPSLFGDLLAGINIPQSSAFDFDMSQAEPTTLANLGTQP